ncbi:MAG: hypothetical protein D8M59_16345 [Planctomycetes bacterium]|nr:hypothetical protein [Planctomycetota bacterium]NOG54319.1 Flp pilus assembly complex ATPase component TadA [Planctomycetota bacterium]
MHPMLVTAQENWYILVGAWTPLLASAILVIWGWLVSDRLDKDAKYWHLAQRNWNMAHLICGLVGFGLMVAPIPVWWWAFLGFPIGILVTFSSTIVYWYHRNSQVPDDKKYHFSFESIRSGMQKRKVARSTKAASISMTDGTGVQRVAPDREDPRYQVHLALEELLSPAFLAGASSLEMVPAKGGQCQVSQIVDTVRYRRNPLDMATASAIIDYFKDLSTLDVEDKRRKQRGDCTAKFGAETFEIRVRTSGTSAGQTMRADFNLKKQVTRKPEELGLSKKQQEQHGRVVENKHGVVLVSAPAGQGRTTSLYTLIKFHDAFTSNIRTLEVEHLLQIDGVGHTEYDPEKGIEFAIQLRSMLRRDPTLMMVSDMVDDRTAQEVAFPGSKGPLTYLGMKSDSAMETLARWIKAVGDMKKAAEPLRILTHQRLMRKLCEHCKLAYQPPAEQLKKLGLPAEQVRQLYKPTGKIIDRNKEIQCPMCNGLGYSGLVAAFEVMSFDDEARSLVAKGDLNAVKVHMRRKQYMTLQQASLRRAIEGTTSIDEVIRVTKSKSSSAGGSKRSESAPQKAAPAKT